VESLSFIYTVPGYGGEDRVYLIRRGRVRAEDVPPAAARDHRRLAHLTDAIYGTTERDSAQVPTHEIDELLLLSSWFRRFPKELERTVRAKDVGLVAVTGPRARVRTTKTLVPDRRAAISA